MISISPKIPRRTRVAEVPALDRLLRELLGDFGFFDGERQMLRYMLRDALQCWIGETACAPGQRELLRRKADFWIFGNYSSEPFFSFAQTCHYLGLHPDFVRRLLRDWRANRKTRARASVRKIQAEKALSTREAAAIKAD
jgi:hypothetical protein